jgi:hypothetical protein
VGAYPGGVGVAVGGNGVGVGVGVAVASAGVGVGATVCRQALASTVEPVASLRSAHAPSSRLATNVSARMADGRAGLLTLHRLDEQSGLLRIRRVPQHKHHPFALGFEVEPVRRLDDAVLLQLARGGRGHDEDVGVV